MILISPAKRLTDKTSTSLLASTEPVFKKEAGILASELAKMSTTELGSMMKVSDNIAELNAARFKKME